MDRAGIERSVLSLTRPGVQRECSRSIIAISACSANIIFMTTCRLRESPAISKASKLKRHDRRCMECSPKLSQPIRKGLRSDSAIS
jgi:hypothetical protein